MRIIVSFCFLLVAAQHASAQAPNVLQALTKTLAADSKPDWPALEYAQKPITKAEADSAAEKIWEAWSNRLREERQAEMDGRELQIGKLKMPFFYKTFGEKPAGGWNLYISMHGGGGGPARMNDGQWENQKRLYSPKQGIYLAPRAPTNTWNLWHQAHIDQFFDRLITNMIVFEGVNPDRVYLMGYSAGGDGVYQLAPRMADRFGATAMMAGHPNETSPLGLRNVPFSLQMGGLDSAYNRNKIAAQWKDKLAKLREDDAGGYEHFVKIYPKKRHWMDREDAVAVEWMAKFERRRFPDRVVWKQDDVVHEQFYWLRASTGDKKRPLLKVHREGQTFTIEESDLAAFTILLNDEMVDLNKPLKVIHKGKTLFDKRASRNIATIAQSVEYRGDPRMVFSASVDVKIDSN